MDQQLSILHLVLDTGETCPVYNEHCLPVADQRRLTLCTYFSSPTAPPPNVRLLEGDGTFKGFLRVFRQALRDRPYDIIHAHSPHFGIFLPIAKLFYPNLTNKLVFTVHNSYFNFKLKNKLYLLPVFALSARVVCCSQASFNSFPKWFQALAGKRLSAIPNGVDLDRIDRVLAPFSAIAPSPETANQDFKIITIGRLIDIKAPLVTLKAFQHFLRLLAAAQSKAQGHLSFVGTGYLEASIERSCQALQLNEQIELAGLISRDEVYQRLHGADVYISTSLGEGLPVAGLEAMACGCPAILSDIPPHRELAAQLDGIPLVPVDDIAGFAQALMHMQQMSFAERSAIGQRCRQLIEDKFSLTAMHRNYESVYIELLSLAS